MTLWVSLGIVTLGLVYELRRDGYDTAYYLAWISASTAGFAALVALSKPTPLTITVGAASVVLWGASLAYRAWNQAAPSAWPDVLLTYADAGAIHESGDVQFAGAGSAKVEGGHACRVDIVVQNCVDAARTIHLELEPESKVGVANRAVLVPDGVKAELRPGEVAKVTLACVAVGRAQGTHPYHWRVVTTGQGGHRVRRRRARSFRVPLLTELISLFSALSITAKGRKVFFMVTPSQSDVLTTHPTFKVESLWQPTK